MPADEAAMPTKLPPLTVIEQTGERVVDVEAFCALYARALLAEEET